MVETGNAGLLRPPTMSLPDDNLLLRFRDGDGDAFAALFARHHRLVFNYARMVLHDAGAAEDMLQETFIAAAGAAARYEPRGHLRAWLLGICRHRCLDWLARRRRRQRIAQETGFVVLDSAPGSSPRHAMQRQERLELTLQALAELPESQREAVTLHALKELSYREIAEVMECPLNTVKTLIRRGRLRLARALAEADGSEP
jgi:RNA polymerase sigma-70 factor (ECF subfamily)